MNLAIPNLNKNGLHKMNTHKKARKNATFFVARGEFFQNTHEKKPIK